MGKKTISLSKANLCIYITKVFSLKEVFSVDMNVTCFLVSLGFCVEIGVSLEFDNISISTAKGQKSRHSFNWLNENFCLDLEKLHMLRQLERS